MQPFVECILIVLLAGFLCGWLRSAPMVDAQFKGWAIWLVGLAAALGVLGRLGVLAHFRTMLG